MIIIIYVYLLENNKDYDKEIRCGKKIEVILKIF